MIIGDPAYPLLSWLMKGYRDSGNLSPEEKLFNHMLSKARMVIENTFGRLKGRWRCLLKRNDDDTDFITIIITACCILHNMCEIHKQEFKKKWLQKKKKQAEEEVVDGGQGDEGIARNIREALTTYFVNHFPNELQRFLWDLVGKWPY